jgi:hypothetical protein
MRNTWGTPIRHVKPVAYKGSVEENKRALDRLIAARSGADGQRAWQAPHPDPLDATEILAVA